jgi:hypothetical protein
MKPERTTLIAEPEQIAAPGPSARTGSDRRHEAERRMLSSSSPDLQLAELEMRDRSRRFGKVPAASRGTVPGGTS